ncbi:MAG: ADP-ribosylglycohydrolase family protein [TACK group archaeon]|nr:ADP-ribosylglycohydrolase family protein [TACK group archaeon]
MGLKVYESFLGALYGTAIGDALGMPTTFLSREEIKKRYGFVDSFLEPPADSVVHSGLKPGTYTDDTELTFALARAIIRAKKVDPRVVAEELIGWADENRALEGNIIGPSTRKAIQLLKEGTPVESSGKEGTTNGCAMKISVVGLFDHSKSFERLFKDVVSACMPTHNTSIAVSGAIAIATSVKLAVKGISPESIVEQAVMQAERAGKLMNGLSIADRIKEALKIEGNDDQEYLDRLYDFLKEPAGALTEDAVPAAISIFLRARGDFRSSVLLACNLGGDSDTIGAMVGAIAGSYSGFASIPKEWIRTVDMNSKTDIRKLARDLLDVSEH